MEAFKLFKNFRKAKFVLYSCNFAFNFGISIIKSENSTLKDESSLHFRYAPVLMQPWIRAIAGLWYLIYLGISIYGCTHLKEGLEPANLLVDDSYATPHYRVLEKHYWHYGASLQIVVSNPPDLRDPVERINMDKMVFIESDSILLDFGFRRLHLQIVKWQLEMTVFSFG